MWFGKARALRRGRDTDSERNWLGAEALPGGALPYEAGGPAQQSPAGGPPVAPARGPAAWLATALRWTRRGRAT